MIYISIESRKGGVGKTTTALTLADLLLSKGYKVLMFDIDIIGTTLDQTFIASKSKFVHEVTWKGERVNLISLFKNIYMAGKNIPSFAQIKEGKSSSFTFEPDKCNFISSSIYEETTKNSDALALIEDPRILYDAFHAYWVLEFVKKVSDSFVSAVRDDHVVVILDNSPGFSSIENCIHDFLTDLGPEKGKILLVSTIDPQDITACRQSKKLIESIFKDKVYAGTYYRSMINSEIKERRKTSAFKTVWNSLCASGGQYPDYHSRKPEIIPSYISILVNKIPRNIIEQSSAKQNLNKKDEFPVPFLSHMLYYFSNPRLKQEGISYRQTLSGQFNMYSLSGDTINIEGDNSRYLKFCDDSNQMGAGHFFDKKWAPLAPFEDLIESMKEQEVLKEQSEWRKIFNDNGHVNIGQNIKDDVGFVVQFVEANLREKNDWQRDLLFVEDFVTSVLMKTHEGVTLDFHTDNPKLQGLGNFVGFFGLAAYRLHIYQQICNLLNKLIEFYLVDVTILEQLDKDSLTDCMNRVLDGNLSPQIATESLMKILSDRISARELRASLQNILDSWNR